MKNKKVLKNLISSVGTYGFLLLLNLFVSRVILVGYGSEVNGLLSSTNQVFTYIALLEAGIGTATIRALYAPIANKDKSSIQEVLLSSKTYYRRAAVLYIICTVIIAVIWPFLLDTGISRFTIFGLILIHGLSSALSFWFTSTITNYLVASGSNYVNNYVHIGVTILTYVFKIIICYLDMSIVFISISLLLVNIIKCIIYLCYMKKNCPEFFVQKKGDLSLLKQRNSFLAHEISGVIFSSTDTIIISIFCGLAEASVYTVYTMVTAAVKNIIWQALSGTYYILGDSYSKDKDEYIKTHDAFNAILITVTFALFTVAYVLALPFVGLYTSGVTDANYLDLRLPLLFVLIELLSICRQVDNNLIKISLHAKETIVRSAIESAINLTISIVLVQFIGIYGVLIGTIVALLYRANDIIIYANKKILKRSPIKEYRVYVFNFAIFGVIALLNKKLNVEIVSYGQLFLYAVIVFVTVMIVYCLANILFNLKTVKPLFKKLKNAKRK
jgi:O-antigen/teichoic acid export membrane protein